MDDMVPQVKEKVKVCPQCNASFVCNPANCWCSNLPQKLPMFDNGDCYCHDCMKEVVDKKSGTPM
jgi:hypothetical protein